MEYAEWAFFAYRKDKHAQESRIVNWQRIAERTGKSLKEIANMPDRSQDVASLWDLYISINKGCDNITYHEIDAFQRITGKVLTPWEVDLMIDLDVMRKSDG